VAGTAAVVGVGLVLAGAGLLAAARGVAEPGAAERIAAPAPALGPVSRASSPGLEDVLGPELARVEGRLQPTAPDVFFALAAASPAVPEPEGAGAAEPLAAAVASGAADLDPAAERAAAEAEAQTGAWTTSGVIQAGGSLAGALADEGVPPETVHTIARELRGVFDFRNAQPGDAYRLIRAPDRALVEFRYSADRATYQLWREDEQWVAVRREPQLERRTARIAGIVSSSLYEAVRDLGESPRLASEFADLFAWDVDFSRMVQPGDEFAVLYERLYRRHSDGRRDYVGPGRILAARYTGHTGEHTAVYFEQEEGRGGYYRADGSAMERQFLVAPLRYSRISSRFSHRRRHPILNVTRPHHGIDYAAPTGTPIYAVADGTVIFRGRGGGYGNLVKVRHANGYVSYYAHMSRFAPELSVGDVVEQKQVLGYVGQSGLATGPHTCFRVAKDGRFVNPATLKTPAGDPVHAEQMPEFELVRDVLLAQLEGSPRIVVADEAL